MIIPVDLIIIDGKAIVDEALLTGESIPISKTSYKHMESNIIINNDLNNVKSCTLFSGTKLIETSNETKNKIKCIAIRTGRFTTQGQLIASIVN